MVKLKETVSFYILGGFKMEKILVKTGIYSFIVSFFLLVVFMKKEESTTALQEGLWPFSN